MQSKYVCHAIDTAPHAVCPAGTYRAPGGKNMCAMCPAYTRTDLVGAVACPCLDGYYRDNQPLPLEGPEADCKGNWLCGRYLLNGIIEMLHFSY